jgi:hypothetical protein
MSVRKIGGSKWEVTARDGMGKQRRRRFESARAARAYERRLADEREQVRQTGRTPRSAEGISLAACAEYLSAHAVKPQTLHALRDRLRVVTHALGHVPLCDLDRVVIGRWANEALPDYAPTTQKAPRRSLLRKRHVGASHDNERDREKDNPCDDQSSKPSSRRNPA